jgi:hypothetical protein
VIFVIKDRCASFCIIGFVISRVCVCVCVSSSSFSFIIIIFNVSVVCFQ